MDSPLLSIVVPTKNRYPYLEKLVELIDGFHQQEIELVIQDNSDNNAEFLSFLNRREYPFIRYAYRPDQIPVTTNADLAILNSTGKYVCFIGDDDGVCRNIIDYVRWMDKNKVESLRSEPPISYSWPGTGGFVFDSSARLAFRLPSGKREFITDFSSIRKGILKRGATDQGKNPRIYCGIVKREVLNKVYSKAGTFFPGPSPDMASSMALSFFVHKHVIIDEITVLAGSCSKSTAGMGKNHQHIRQIQDVPWLPKDSLEKWEKSVPRLWTGETIYAESAIKSIRAMGQEQELRHMSYPYLYAAFCVYHFSSFDQILHLLSFKSFIPFSIGLFKVSLIRLVHFMKNLIRRLSLTSNNVAVYENVIDIIECERLVNNACRK